MAALHSCAAAQKGFQHGAGAQVLDADHGAGWNLAAALLRPRQVQASTAQAPPARCHPEVAAGRLASRKRLPLQLLRPQAGLSRPLTQDEASTSAAQVTGSGAVTFKASGKKRASVREALRHRFMAQARPWCRQVQPSKPECP